MTSKYISVMSILDRLERTHDRLVLEQMISMPEITKDSLQDEAFLEQWAADIQAALIAAINGAKVEYRVEAVKSDEGITGIRVIRTQHGVDEARDISIHFFESPEYAAIVDLGNDINGLIGEGAYVLRGEHRKEVATFKQAVDWIMGEARKGQSIQRYKGLGEMNPDQLWDTTVNPETRRLMQVRIEDAVKPLMKSSRH